MTSDKDIHAQVEKAYGAIARGQAGCAGSLESSCCSGSSCCGAGASAMPEAELGLSCGNPVAFSQLEPGDAVVDLGSGAGKDVFFAAQAVGPGGRAIGIDMTMDMLLLANRNAELFKARTGLDNVEFRQGHIENIPVDDASVDAVISNCVINLSPDKAAVFREVFRVLKPGGRMIVSDIVLNREIPDDVKSDENLYTACIAGALKREDYFAAIKSVGFPEIEILADDVRNIEDAGLDPIAGPLAEQLATAASSVTLLAVKPGCCAGGCCG